MYTYKHVDMHVYVCTCIYLYICTYTCVDKCRHGDIHAHPHLPMRICILLCIHI